MNEQIKGLVWKAGGKFYTEPPARQVTGISMSFEQVEKFTELIVRECVNEIETYQIPVGNSPAGEMAGEWTYESLKEIQNNIKEKFGIE